MTEDTTMSSFPMAAIAPASEQPPAQLQAELQRRLATVLSFEDWVKLGELYSHLQWGPLEEFRVLVEIVRYSDDNKEKMRALRMLADRRAEVMKHSGLLVSAQQTSQDALGTRRVLTSSIVASVLNQNTQLKLLGAENVKEKHIESTPEPNPLPVPDDSSPTPAADVSGPVRGEPNSSSGLAFVAFNPASDSKPGTTN